jgi:hypothetical protein
MCLFSSVTPTDTNYQMHYSFILFAHITFFSFLLLPAFARFQRKNQGASYRPGNTVFPEKPNEQLELTPTECHPSSISPLLHFAAILHFMETACKLTIRQGRSSGALVQV